MKCPHCKSELQEKKYPDITIDDCPECGGVFLDKGELNVLATGMAGDIEFCSIDNDEHIDKHEERLCPACVDVKMRKVNLLAFSNLIFDFCPKCEGFFLDKGEAEAMNEELSKVSKERLGEEIRQELHSHFVTVERIFGVDTAFVTHKLTRAQSKDSSDIPQLTFLRISLFLKNPLSLGLYLYEEKWTTKLAKLFGLTSYQDIEVGEDRFDGSFFVGAREKEETLALLTEERQKGLLSFLANKPNICGKTPKFYFLDDRLVLTVGPFTEALPKKLAEPCDEAIKELASLANLFAI